MLKTKQAVIFAGGLGTRMSEVTSKIPKPTVEVGGAPIIFHLMEIFHNQGVKNIVILGGYKFSYLKSLFKNGLVMPNLNASIKAGLYAEEFSEKFKDLNIQLVFTGEKSETGTRLLKAKRYLDDNFFITYGDGLANVSLEGIENQFYSGSYDACMSVVNPTSRYGEFYRNSSGKVVDFAEKPVLKDSLVNAGFGLISRNSLRYIKQDGNHSFESTLLKLSAKAGRLTVHHHKGYFRSIDTLRDIEDTNKEMAAWGGKKIW